ncbi:MAG: cell division protein FtsL [Syntrophales bacterium]|nr:cell division protein FtsL [Syntrophales bacterium]
MAGVPERQERKLRASHIVFGLMMLMFATLGYVWFQVNITKLNYEIAREMRTQENLLEEARQLKIEIETLESPRRIETLAKEKLRMSYPVSSQVLLLDD